MSKAKTTMAYAMGVIIAILIIFSFISNASTSMRQSAESISDANNCSDTTDGAGVAYSYNITSGLCQNSSVGAEDLYDTFDGTYDLPLSALFDVGGVAMLLLMAGILIAVIVIAIKRRR